MQLRSKFSGDSKTLTRNMEHKYHMFTVTERDHIVEKRPVLSY